MARITFPKLSERVFAVRAAWRRQLPLRVRVEAVRRAATPSGGPVPVVNGDAPNPVDSATQPSSPAGPPVRRVHLEASGTRVA